MYSMSEQMYVFSYVLYTGVCATVLWCVSVYIIKECVHHVRFPVIFNKYFLAEYGVGMQGQDTCDNHGN